MGTKKHYDELDLLAQAQSNPDLQVTIVDHPLIRHLIEGLRNKDTSSKEFRELIRKITIPLLFEATKDLEEEKVDINTPLAPITARNIATAIVLAPILRSGLGMTEIVQDYFPEAPVVHIGLKRDERTAQAHWYYDLQELEWLNKGDGVTFLILDPMLATGGSASEIAARIQEVYPKATRKMVAIISAPEGIKHLNKEHPDVPIVTAVVDDYLNEIAYIVPGLGDAGDRQFGT